MSENEFEKAFDKAFKAILVEIGKQPFEQSVEDHAVGIVLPSNRIKQLAKRLYNAGYTKGTTRKVKN